MRQVLHFHNHLLRVQGMPTKKARVYVTLPDELHEKLQAVKSVTGQPTSALIVELLEATVPTLEKMITVFGAARDAVGQDRAKIVEALNKASDEVLPVAVEVFAGFDSFCEEMEKLADAGRATGAQAPADGQRQASLPPSTNRGVTNRAKRGAEGQKTGGHAFVKSLEKLATARRKG